MLIYNQKLDKYSSMACSIETIYHILEFKYWIVVSDNFILKSLKVFETLWTRSPIKWAIFETIYNSFEKELNKKLWINIKIITKQINELTDWDTWTRWIGMPKYHFWLNLIDDNSFDYDDVEEFLKYSWKTYAHSIAWDWSKLWYLINSDWTRPLPCTLWVLKHMANKWVIRSTCRTISHWTEETRNILQICLMMQKANLQWKLKEYLETNKDNVYLKKAKELFDYWK